MSYAVVVENVSVSTQLSKARKKDAQHTLVQRTSRDVSHYNRLLMEQNYSNLSVFSYQNMPPVFSHLMSSSHLAFCSTNKCHENTLEACFHVENQTTCGGEEWSL